MAIDGGLGPRRYVGFSPSAAIFRPVVVNFPVVPCPLLCYAFFFDAKDVDDSPASSVSGFLHDFIRVFAEAGQIGELHGEIGQLRFECVET